MFSPTGVNTPFFGFSGPVCDRRAFRLSQTGETPQRTRIGSITHGRTRDSRSPPSPPLCAGQGPNSDRSVTLRLTEAVKVKEVPLRSSLLSSTGSIPPVCFLSFLFPLFLSATKCNHI